MNSSNFTLIGNFTFNITQILEKQPIELSLSETKNILSGFNITYNVSDNISISTDNIIPAKNISFKVLCLSASNSTLIDQIYDTYLDVSGDIFEN